MAKYTVKYYAGPYSGKRTVEAEDEQHAIAQVRREIRALMTLPMYSDGYRIVDGKNDDDEDE